MKWTPVKGSERYALSASTPRGTYHVSKGLVHGVARYTAWPPKPTASEDRPWQERVHTSLGCFDDADSAKRCCEQHAGMTQPGATP